MAAPPTFEESLPFEKRLAEAERIMKKYPDRVAVICERAPREIALPVLPKVKFLVPGTMTISEFKYIVHKHLVETSDSLPAEQTIYLFARNTSLRTNCALQEAYDVYKSDDGFLYITYKAEDVFGSM